MNRTDRLTGIVLALRGGRRTVGVLADRFAVSRRTILRDIAALSEIGVPVVTVSGTGGGVELADGYWLPPLHLTAGEAATLLLGLQSLGTGEAPLATERRAAKEKLHAVLDTDLAGRVSAELDFVAVSSAAGAASQAIFATLHDAIRRGGWVTGTYQSERQVAQRVLRPIRLLLEDGRWYCLASTPDGDRERRYRVDRFVDLHPCARPETPPRPMGAEEHPELPAYDDPNYPELIIRFTYVGMRRAEDERGWRDHMTSRGDGTWEVRFRCPPDEHAFYARLVFALGPEANAIAPLSFRAMVRSLAQQTVARYGESP